MILLVDLCNKPKSLSRNEFIGPVARIVTNAGYPWQIVHFTDVSDEDVRNADGIILCGTALQDNVFASQNERFAWLRSVKVPVLGICAGMQAICIQYGGSLRKADEIGMTTVRISNQDPLLGDRVTFEAYELHSFACDGPLDWIVTARSDTCVQSIRNPDKQIYGVMFHPEVRNDVVVERFCALCRH